MTPRRDCSYVKARIRVANNGCWEWQLKPDSHGYGKAYGGWSDGRSVYVGAHRYSYEAFVGPIPEGLHLDHLCRNTMCVNPEHLEPVTTQINTLRGELHLHRGKYQLDRETCAQGHPWSPENTAVGHNMNGRPKRVCKTCRDTAALASRRKAVPEQCPADAHGTLHGYTYYKCRCQPCVDNQAQFQRNRRLARKMCPQRPPAAA